MVKLSLAAHSPSFFTSTVYWVVCFGEALGSGQSVQLKPSEGDHFHETTSDEPVACNCTPVDPTSMVWSGPASTVGIGNTTMKTLAVSTKQFALSVAVTVYRVLLVGLACGEALFGSFNPVDGCHEY